MTTASNPVGSFVQPVGFVLSEEAAQGDRAAQKLMALVSDTEKFLREVKTPSVSNLAFEACGLPFKARHTPEEPEAHLLIWGILGYLPYSVISHKKRQELISVLEATHRLSHVKFGVTPHMQIVVFGDYKIKKPLSPDYLFVPLVRFLEEALPFIRLVGETL